MKSSHYLLLLLALSVSHCKKSSSKSDEGQAAGANGDTSNGDTSNGGSKAEAVDYPKLYCENVTKLSLRDDLTEELKFFCQSGKPTKEFLDFRSKALAQAPGAYELKMLQAEHAEDSTRSEFLVAWAYRLPLRPLEIKSRPIYDYVAQSFTTDTIDLKASSSRLPDENRDGGLHIWSANLSYDLILKAGQGLTLTSQRNTQYNLYQVKASSEEMGFGEEHLIDVDNPNYTRSVMLNVSFNDGSDLNSGKGGTVVITLLHFVLNNQNFPSTATKSIQEIAQHAADGMYNGLKQ